MMAVIQNLPLSPVRNRELVVEMAKRELKGSGCGAVLGSLWLVLGPLIQTLAYVVIVSFIFQARGAVVEVTGADGASAMELLTKSVQKRLAL